MRDLHRDMNTITHKTFNRIEVSYLSIDLAWKLDSIFNRTDTFSMLDNIINDEINEL